MIKEQGEEWLVFLKGTKSPDGTLIQCNDIFVPPDQKRSTGHVDIDEVDVPEEFPVVLHSHHSMGAFFSSIDLTKLNTRCAASIVVSTRIESVEGTHLGFEYRAVARVPLPCGDLGIIDMVVEPSGIEGWPRTEVPGLVGHELASTLGFKGFGACDKQSQIQHSPYWKRLEAVCGVKDTVEYATPVDFINTGEIVDISSQLPVPRANYIQSENWQETSPGHYVYRGGAVQGPQSKSFQGYKKTPSESADWHAWGDYYDAWDDLAYPQPRGESKILAQEKTLSQSFRDAELEAEADEYLQMTKAYDEAWIERLNQLREEQLLDDAEEARLLEMVDAFKRSPSGLEHLTDEDLIDYLEAQERKAEVAYEAVMAMEHGSEKD